MLLTEEEARQKWCPHARSFHNLTASIGGVAHTVAGVAINRDRPSGEIPACIASHCMAWRFGEPPILRDIDLVTSDVVDRRPRRGYCGAFGVVQHED